MYRIIVVVFITVVFGASLTVTASSLTPITLNATTFYTALMDDIIIDSTTTTGSSRNKKWFDVIVDVRTQSEYTTGHINGSTLVESLASFNTTDQISTPQALHGCDYCDIVVYCRSGSRAATAIQHLIDAGYQGQLYTMVWVCITMDRSGNIHYGSTTSLSYQPVRRIRQWVNSVTSITDPITTTTIPSSPILRQVQRRRLRHHQSWHPPASHRVILVVGHYVGGQIPSRSGSHCYTSYTTHLWRCFETSERERKRDDFR